MVKICQIDDYSGGRAGGGHINGIKAWKEIADYTSSKFRDFSYDIRSKEDLLMGDLSGYDYYQSHCTPLLFGAYRENIEDEYGLDKFIPCLHGFTSFRFYRWSYEHLKHETKLHSALQRVAKILGSSRAYADFLSGMGITTPTQGFTTHPRSFFREHKGRYESGDQLFSVGRVAYEKGADMLIQLAEKGHNIKFAGRPLSTTPDGMLEGFKNTPNLDFKGTVEHGDMPQFYQTGKMLVHPSRMESSPLIIKESLLSRRPVIAFNVGDTEDLVYGVDRDYECGIVLPFKPDIKRNLSTKAGRSPDFEGFDVVDQEYRETLVDMLSRAIEEVEEDYDYFKSECERMMENGDYAWNLDRNADIFYRFYAEDRDLDQYKRSDRIFEESTTRDG